MEKKSKKPIIIMIVTSVIIIALGMICGVAVYSDLIDQMVPGESGIYVDGTDVSGLVNSFGQMGALVLSTLVVCAALLAVLVQWLTYFIVRLIKKAIDRKRNPPMQYHYPPYPPYDPNYQPPYPPYPPYDPNYRPPYPYEPSAKAPEVSNNTTGEKTDRDFIKTNFEPSGKSPDIVNRTGEE